MTATILASFPSPAQGVWHLGPLPIRAYALCIIVGIVAALIIGDRRWVARGGDRGLVYDVALWAVPFGLVGGRLYHVMTDWKTYFGDDGLGFVAALKIWDGGLGIWGAVALGGVGAWIACRHHGVPLPAFGDAIAPGIILAQAIGRLGNYFNQELYGRETTLPWGLEIFERRNASGQTDMLNGVSTGVPLYDHPVHPTFLYELLWNLLIFGILIWADRRFKLGHGRLFALYVAGYCVGRFWVELMRNDYATLIAGIRVNTFTSTFVFIGAVIYIMVAPKGREDPKTLRSKIYAESEDAKTDTLVGELAAVAATSGVVAAAKVAGREDREDAPAGPGDRTEPDKHSEAAAEAEELAKDVETAPSEDIAVAEEFAAAGDKTALDSEGVGAVDGDEVAEAVVEAPEVHEAAVEAADDAEEVAKETAQPPEPEAESTEVAEASAEEVAQPDPEPESEPQPADDAEGLGAVEGDEVGEAVADASEVHEAAVESAEVAEASAEEVAQPEPEPESEPQPADDAEGLGAVEGDEVGEAVADASEVHEAAVESAEVAEASAEEVAQPEPEPESEPQPADDAEGLGAVEGDEVGEAVADASEVHEAAIESAEEGAEEPAQPEPEPADDAEAPEVHEATAVESAAVAEDVPAEEAAEPEPEPESKPASDPEPEPANDAEGLGAVEGDEVGEAVAEAPEVHEAAAEAAGEAEQGTEKSGATDVESVAEPVAKQSRNRWWRRD